MRRLARACGLAATLAIGCAPPRPPTHATSLYEEAKAEGISLVDPIDIDARVVEEARAAMPIVGSTAFKLRALLSFLNASGHVSFQHTPGRSLTARDAYREGRGDCMAYAHLFTAIARRLGLATYYVHVTEVRSYYERSGWFFVSSHVAIGHGEGPSTVVLDLTREISNWKLAFYERIDDREALALYYNNVAVDLMTAGRTREAERLFRFFVARAPGVVEIHNNLGVLLNRTRRYEEGRALLDRAIARFPRYEPLYTNALAAARALGRDDLAADYERRGRAISRDDPYFLFARAISLFERGKHALAAEMFARSSSAKPDSAVILAWLARAHASAGNLREARAAFARARRIEPLSPVLQDLAARHPELAAPPD